MDTIKSGRTNKITKQLIINSFLSGFTKLIKILLILVFKIKIKIIEKPHQIFTIARGNSLKIFEILCKLNSFCLFISINFPGVSKLRKC